MIERSFKSLWDHRFHRVAYNEWPGPAGARTLVCLPGLTRNASDFDALGRSLSKDMRVICPDFAGRGKSEWMGDPAAYGNALYLTDLAALYARLDVDTVDLLGTSMGAMVGILFACFPGTPVRRLVLNDFGPLIAKEGLERIAGFADRDPVFHTIDEVEQRLRKVAAPWGPLTDAQWRYMALHTVRHRPDGTLGLAYDPHVGDATHTESYHDIDLWAQWDLIRCPSLVLHGELSDVLRHDDAVAMTRRGPRAKLVEFPGIGHAPALLEEDQINVVREFLLAPDP
jgi:pimeloyl-ACP methyl ester carboxylesterase